MVLNRVALKHFMGETFIEGGFALILILDLPERKPPYLPCQKFSIRNCL